MNKNITIIGCGISSATLANILANKGWNVTIYEKTNHVGGNCFDSFDSNGILIHNFGPHIFHTSYEDVYTFVSQFTKFNNYVNKVLVSVDNKLFPLPINFKSIEEIMGSKSAKKIICQLQQLFPNKETATLFDLRMIDNVEIKQFVDWISQNVYLNYSAKMWGTKFENIDPNTISRVKIILGYNHNYFPNDKYQGLPTEGYTKMIEAMLRHPNIKVNLNVDALKHIKFDNEIKWDDKKLNGPVVYCGPLDEALDYKYGILPYRSLNIQFETHNVTDFQKTAVVNYPADPTMTRIAEYKKMTLQSKKGITTISKEFPGQFKLNDVVFGHRYYPIINETNLSLYNKYLNFFKQYKNFYPLGRLSQYKYYDIDDVIKQAIDLAKELINA